MSLILDPMGDLAETMSQVENLLLFCDADSDEEVALLDYGAYAAGSLAAALRASATDGPTLIAPDGRTSLGPILRCPSTSRYLSAVLQAIKVIPAGELRRQIPNALPALEMVGRCLPQDPGPPGTGPDQRLHEQAQQRPGDSLMILPTPWEDAVTADQVALLAAWPEQPRTRWVLTTAQLTAYKRLCHTILLDPLERFAAMG